MLTCQCIANEGHTQIITPCLLHAQWAKSYAATQHERWVGEADRPKPLDAYGPRAGEGKGKATTR